MALFPKNFRVLFGYAGNVFVENSGKLATVDYRFILKKFTKLEPDSFVFKLCAAGRIIRKIR